MSYIWDARSGKFVTYRQDGVTYPVAFPFIHGVVPSYGYKFVRAGLIYSAPNCASTPRLITIQTSGVADIARDPEYRVGMGVSGSFDLDDKTERLSSYLFAAELVATGDPEKVGVIIGHLDDRTSRVRLEPASRDYSGAEPAAVDEEEEEYLGEEY